MTENPKQVEFAPAVPIPYVVDVKERIKELETFLDPTNPKYEPERQHPNIRTAIKLYQEGKIDGIEHTFIVNGEVTPFKDIVKPGAAIWVEGFFSQMTQKCTYGHGNFGANKHEIKMFLRLVPQLGGDGSAYPITVLNDTGSDIMAVFTTDLLQLGEGLQAYNGWLANINIANANGMIDTCRTIILEVQLVRDDLSPWTDWIREVAIVRVPQLAMSRLTGSMIRQELYFGTAPGNHSLAISTSKSGLSSLL